MITQTLLRCDFAHLDATTNLSRRSSSAAFIRRLIRCQLSRILDRALSRGALRRGAPV